MEPNYQRHLRHSSSVRVSDPESGLTSGHILYAKPGGGKDSTTAGVQQVISNSVPAVPAASFSIPAAADKPSTSISASSSSSSRTDPMTAPSPENLKPKFKPFDQFLKEHSYNTVDLPLSQSYGPKTLKRGQPNIIPPAATLKHQAYRHLDHVEFMNLKEMDQFVRYWRHQLDMQQQRAGWLFGYFREDKHYELGIRAVVEAIYEPPQIFECNDIVLLEDPFLSTVKTLAASLKLELVGWIFTHLPREELLTSDEVKRIAQLQLDHVGTSHYTGYPISPFVTVTVALDVARSDNPVSTNAYMVSDLGMAFQRDGLLADSTDLRRMQLRATEKDELLPDILESGKTTTSFDPDWLIVRVNDSAPKQPRSLFESWSFPVENRQYQVKPSDVPAHLKLSSKSSLSPWADWHFLLYIARLFDVQTASVVCESVLEKKAVEPALLETFKLL